MKFYEPCDSGYLNMRYEGSFEPLLSAYATSTVSKPCVSVKIILKVQCRFSSRFKFGSPPSDQSLGFWKGHLFSRSREALATI